MRAYDLLTVNMNDRVVKERQNNLLAAVQNCYFYFLQYTVQYVRPYFALISYVVCTYRIKYKYFDKIQTLKKTICSKKPTNKKSSKKQIAISM